jgi:hypothetical protein
MENERSKEWVLDRVRKLMAVANDGGATEGERDNAMRMAHKLLAKYNVSMAEAEAKQPGDTEDRIIHRSQFFGRPWARVAAQAVAKLFFCEYIYTPASRGKDVTHFFIGRETNAITAASMAKYIVESIMREGKKNQRAEDAGNIYYRSFATAASVTIYKRVERMIAEASKTDQGDSKPGTALIVANHYLAERDKNKAKIADTFSKLGQGRSGSDRFDADGGADGRRYGESVSLDRQLGGPTPDRKRLS